VSRTRSFTRSQARSLLSMPRSNSASSLARFSICSLVRIAQTSLGLNGAFCPTSLPLFQGAPVRGLFVHSMMDVLGWEPWSRAARIRRPDAQGRGAGPGLARSIFVFKLSAIGLRLRAALTGHVLTDT
jgi:hypothetical protein